MKQKNFSKVLAKGDARSPLWTTLSEYPAKLLSKYSLIALLITAFLFPSNVVAQKITITSDDAKLPVGVLYQIGDIPQFTKEVRGDHFNVIVDSIVKLTTWGVDWSSTYLWSSTNSWPLNVPVQPGDIYKVSIIMEADEGYAFGEPFVVAQNLPAATPVTNWGTSINVLKTTSTFYTRYTSGEVKKFRFRVAYQIPKTVTQLAVGDDASGVSLDTKLKVGDQLPAGAASTIQGATSSPQWKGDLTWTLKTGATTPARFTADSVNYIAHVAIKAEPGYTFIGVPASQLTWNTTISSNTTARETNAKDTPYGPTAGDFTATFKAFSRFPARPVSTDKTTLAGALSGGIGVTLPRGIVTDWSYAEWSTGLSTDGKFLPDSTYSLSFKVTTDPAATGQWASATLKYGFFGLPADHYTAGANLAGVAHNPKTVWRTWANYNTADTLTITFAPTEQNPASGNVKLPLTEAKAGQKSTLRTGDELEIEGLTGAKAYFDQWVVGDVVSASLAFPTGSDSIFQPETTYSAAIKLVAEDGYTTYYLKEVIDVLKTREYTIGDSVAAWRWHNPADDDIWKEIYIAATFTTETRITAIKASVGVPHPIAGLTAGERQALLDVTTPAAFVEKLESVAIEWTDKDGNVLANDDVFAPKAEYTAKAILTPKAGYTFYGVTAANVVYIKPATTELNPVILNLAPATGVSVYESKKAVHLINSNELTVYFQPTAQTITVDTIAKWVAPKPGVKVAAANTAFTDNKSYKATVEYFDEAGEALAVGDVFQASTVYTAEIKVEALRDKFYTFAGYEKAFAPKDATATRLETETVVTEADNYQTVKYEFVKTADLITIQDLEFTGTDFIFPATGYAKTAIPAVGDVIVENDEYTAEVRTWDPAFPTSGKFTKNVEYTLTLRVTPKAGYTAYGITPVGTWFEYIAGGAQVQSVVTKTPTSTYVDVVINFGPTLQTITTSLSGFPAAVEKGALVKKEDIGKNTSGVPSTQFEVTTFDVTGEYTSDKKYYAGEEYTYTFNLAAKTGYTLVGLAKNSLKVTGTPSGLVGAIVTNDANGGAEGTVTVTFTSAGQRLKNYVITIAVPAAGEFPAVESEVYVEWTEDNVVKRVFATNVTWSGIWEQGRFKKGNTYSVGITLDNTLYSFFGVPENAFSVKDYPSSLAITENQANNNKVTIQFPQTSDALVLKAPIFTFVSSGYAPIAPGKILIENNTARVYEIVDIILSGTSAAQNNYFELTKGTTYDVYPNDGTHPGLVDDWTITPVQNIPKGKHSATITLYYIVKGAPVGTKEQVDATVVLDVYGVGLDAPEAAALNAYGTNGLLTVKGLVAGEPFSVHNAQGALIYRGIAKANEAIISVPVKGVYIVTSVDKKLKVVNK